MNRSCYRLPLVLFSLLLASHAYAQSTPGTRWRVTTSMQGMGMSFPGHTTEVCEKGSQQDAPAPPAENKECTFTQLEHTGNTVKYAVRCSGRESMQGTGEVVYGPDNYKGTFNLKSKEGEMSMSYEGTKLGACNGSEINDPAKMRAQQQAADEALKKINSAPQGMAPMCMKWAQETNDPNMFYDANHSGQVACTDAASRQAYCSAFQTYKPFMDQDQREKNFTTHGVNDPLNKPFSNSLKLCGLEADTVRKKLCNTAEADGVYDFLRKECPVQAAAIGARECSGRSYTSVSAKYRTFCSGYASDIASTPAAPAEQTQSTVQEKAKKALKGLFGH